MEKNTNSRAAIFAALAVLALLAAGVGFVLRSGPLKDGVPAPGQSGGESQPRAVQTGGNPSWTVFHGNAALTGFIDTDIPDKPEKLWTFNSEGRIPITASPIVADGRVFVGSMDNSLYALNFADGKQIWRADTEGSIEGTPCYADGKVFVGSYDTKLYAFDAKNGEKLWSFKTGAEIKGGPNYVNGKIIVGSYDYKVYCIDAKTGVEAWNFETSNYVNGTPAVADGKMIFGGCDGLLHVVSIETGKEEKAIEAGAYIAASVAIDGGVAYVGHQQAEFLAADLNKGEVLWRFPSPKEEPFMSSPAVSKDFVVVGCDDKMLHCLQRKDGKAAWSFAARGKITSSPVIVRDRVLVGDHSGRVYMIALKDGTKLWEYEIGASVDTSAAISNNVFIFGAKDGSVTAFGKKK